MKKFKKGDKLEIWWQDTFGFNGWWEEEDLDKKTKEMDFFIRSTGLFIKEDKGWILLAMHENPHNSFAPWGHVDWIPKGCIKKIKKVK